MAQYRIDRIAELARQLAFAPAQTRSIQIASAEDLLHELAPTRAYPLEYVVFRVTGFAPRGRAVAAAIANQGSADHAAGAYGTGIYGASSPDLLTGLALQHDLGLLIEQLSDSLELLVRAAAEPVLSIEDVTEKFNITSKTVQRWRRRGLPGRRFVFPDGRKRVGFLLSSVERFFAAHSEQVAGGVNLSRVESSERDRIVSFARRLARAGLCEAELTRRIARRLHRSPLTILHTLRKHDQETPDIAILPTLAPPPREKLRQRILKRWRRGASIRRISRRLAQRPAVVYRVVMDERIARLTRSKTRFIDDPLYHEPDAASIVGHLVSQDVLGAPPPADESRVPRDLPAYLAALYRTPLLTPSRERALFLQFNFHKYCFVSARRRLDPQFARHRDLKVMEEHAQAAAAVKSKIIQANLRLVVSIARKHARPGLALMELISDGNITLMRAIEGFDAHKGYRFSTYATLSLMKGFARSVPLMQSHNSAMQLSSAEELPDRSQLAAEARLIDRDEVHGLLERLDEPERRVLRAHYGLGADHAPATFQQVADAMGLSSHRVRQIERDAIEKLRAHVR
jgi:RNA polymerase sigma factor (sigma-70 family)